MAHTGAPEFFVYRRVVYRNKTIGLEQVEEFVKEIVGVLSNELEKVMNVVAMEPSNAPRLIGRLVDYIARHLPELLDPVKRASREAAALEDVVKGEELTLRELDGGELDVAADCTVHG